MAVAVSVLGRCFFFGGGTPLEPHQLHPQGVLLDLPCVIWWPGCDASLILGSAGGCSPPSGASARAKNIGPIGHAWTLTWHAWCVACGLRSQVLKTPEEDIWFNPAGPVWNQTSGEVVGRAGERLGELVRVGNMVCRCMRACIRGKAGLHLTWVWVRACAREVWD